MNLQTKLINDNIEFVNINNNIHSKIQCNTLEIEQISNKIQWKLINNSIYGELSSTDINIDTFNEE